MHKLLQPVSKTCEFCKMQFWTKTPDKMYCTIKCRGAMNRKRERESEVKQSSASDAQAESQMYFVPPVMFPDEQRIRQIADAMVLVETNKPTLFRAPDLHALPGLPPGITFGPSLFTKNEWVMVYEKPMTLEEYQRLNPNVVVHQNVDLTSSAPEPPNPALAAWLAAHPEVGRL